MEEENKNYSDELLKNIIKNPELLENLSDELINNNESYYKIAREYINILKDTSYKKDIIENNIKRYYNNDENLKIILNSRRQDIVDSALSEQEIETLTLRIVQFSNVIGHEIEKYTEDDVQLFGSKSMLSFKNLIGKLEKKFTKKSDINDIIEWLNNINTKEFNYKDKNYLNIKKFVKANFPNLDYSNEKYIIERFSNNVLKSHYSQVFMKIKEKSIDKIIRYPQKINIGIEE